MKQSNLLYIFYIIVLLLVPLLTITLSSATELEKAKDFKLQDISGKTYQLSELKGNVVLINFWATWCKYCIRENPSLDRLYRRFKDREFIVLGISIDRSVATVRDFLRMNPVSYPVLLDSKGEVFVKTYTVVGVPATFIINKEGYIVSKLIGEQKFDSMKYIRDIDALLGGSGK